MPRLFTVELFNEYITGTGMVISPSEFRDVLGRADVLAIQVYVSKSGGTSPTLTLQVQHGNDGRRIVTHSTPINAASIASVPFEVMVAAGDTADPLGAMVQLAITLGGTNPEAYVQVTVTGRSF